MKNDRKKSEAELAKGQVWRTGDAYLQIMDRGKRLIMILPKNWTSGLDGALADQLIQ
jgi:hypothetical protein